MRRSWLCDSLHVFLDEFIEHLFHALGSWSFDFYLIAPLFHPYLPVTALIRHEQDVESIMVLSSNCLYDTSQTLFLRAPFLHSPQILIRLRKDKIRFVMSTYIAGRGNW